MRAAITELRELVARPKTEMAAPPGTTLEKWQKAADQAAEAFSNLKGDLRAARRMGQEDYGEKLWREVETAAKECFDAAINLRTLLSKLEREPEEHA